MTKVAITTKLHKAKNKELIEYYENKKVEYNSMMRTAFAVYKNEPKANRSTVYRVLRDKYETPGVITNTVTLLSKNNYTSHYALKKYRKGVLEKRLGKQEAVAAKLEQQLASFKEKALVWKTSLHSRDYKNLRLELWAAKKRVHQTENALKQLLYQLESGRINDTFGTKELQRKDKEAFIQARDCGIAITGNKGDSQQNPGIKLFYNKTNNTFRIEWHPLFKDFYDKENSGVKTGECFFKKHQKLLVRVLEKKSCPLFYRLYDRSGEYYLQCVFSWPQQEEKTTALHGTIGCDFNKGFVTVAETDASGNLISTNLLNYRFGKGGKTRHDLRIIAKELATMAADKGKDLIIEGLQFSNKKASVIKAKSSGKKYNRMITSLAYARFIESVEAACFKQGVFLRKVNPAWTSFIAKNEFCHRMKLNTHVGAAFVIARRGQGFKDSVKKSS